MSRKHYIAVAAAFAGSRKSPDMAYFALDALAEKMADIFAADNSLFDRARFLKACKA